VIDKWFSAIELPLTFEQFEQLPQNPAYKYEYFEGTAWLSPRPKSYHAVLDLPAFAPPIETLTEEPVHIRPLVDDDWESLPGVFAAAFHRVQPFASVDDDTRLQAARECLQSTRDGREGPLIAEACLVATAESDEALLGGVLTTLIPPGDLTDWSTFRWKTPPPPDAVARRMGGPHLTWIFVSPWFARSGVGTALLDAAVRGLVRLGYTELASTFLLGNDSSLLWHWRMGFRPYPGSMRMIRQQVRHEREG
jgi:GNAT superfamily N-acetyltransferase